MIWFSLLVLLLTLSAQAATPTLFTHMSPESERDPRVTYDRELLRLALEKTRASHGDFQLRAAPPHWPGCGSACASTTIPTCLPWTATAQTVT